MLFCKQDDTCRKRKLQQGWGRDQAGIKKHLTDSQKDTCTETHTCTLCLHFLVSSHPWLKAQNNACETMTQSGTSSTCQASSTGQSSIFSCCMLFQYIKQSEGHDCSAHPLSTRNTPLMPPPRVVRASLRAWGVVKRTMTSERDCHSVLYCPSHCFRNHSTSTSCRMQTLG